VKLWPRVWCLVFFDSRCSSPLYWHHCHQKPLATHNQYQLSFHSATYTCRVFDSDSCSLNKCTTKCTNFTLFYAAWKIYDARCYFNVRSKADIHQLIYRTEPKIKKKWKTEKLKSKKRICSEVSVNSPGNAWSQLRLRREEERARTFLLRSATSFAADSLRSSVACWSFA